MPCDRKPRVLVVDDDAVVLESMRAVLADDFDVTTAISAAAALGLFTDGLVVDVVCADWKMPEMDGVRLCGHILRRPSACCCILVTGHAGDLLTEVEPEQRRYLGVLRKPFHPQELIDRVTHFAGIAAMKRATARLSTTMGKVSP